LALHCSPTWPFLRNGVACAVDSHRWGCGSCQEKADGDRRHGSVLLLSGLERAAFYAGVLGVLFGSNALVMFMSVEWMLNAVNLTLITYSRVWGNVDGQVFVLLVMAGGCGSRGRVGHHRLTLPSPRSTPMSTK
jgi:NADH:ubiquinone oxidoreductase subunit K